MKRALITGITGMDGSYLAEFLLEKDYKVFGMERRTSTKNRVNTSHLENKITFLMGDLSDQSSLLRVLKESNPDEVYNLASQSFVKESWNTPEQSADITGAGGGTIGTGAVPLPGEVGFSGTLRSAEGRG